MRKRIPGCLLLLLGIFLGCAGGVAGDDTKNKQKMNLFLTKLGGRI